MEKTEEAKSVIVKIRTVDGHILSARMERDEFVTFTSQLSVGLNVSVYLETTEGDGALVMLSKIVSVTYKGIYE